MGRHPVARDPFVTSLKLSLSQPSLRWRRATNVYLQRIKKEKQYAIDDVLELRVAARRVVLALEGICFVSAQINAAEAEVAVLDAELIWSLTKHLPHHFRICAAQKWTRAGVRPAAGKHCLQRDFNSRRPDPDLTRMALS